MAPTSASTPEHHESAGLVERFHSTLIGMTRAANEGGAHWPQHLPFLLFSYRATPHRATRHSPAVAVPVQWIYRRNLHP